MKPVYQTIVDPGRGDCWRACIASILELPIEEVPNFVAEFADNPEITHYELCSNWLRERGLFMVDINLSKVDEWFYVIDWQLIKSAYGIATVPSQKNKGGWHSVVIHFGGADNTTSLKIIHDPRIDNESYPDDVKFRRMQFIVPILPRISLR
jgi:hypothetical protein